MLQAFPIQSNHLSPGRPAATVYSMSTLWTILSQCAMCKDSLQQSTSDSQSMWTRGFNSSILFLLGLVFSLIGAIVFKVWRIMREEDRKSAAVAESAPRP